MCNSVGNLLSLIISNVIRPATNGYFQYQSTNHFGYKMTENSKRFPSHFPRVKGDNINCLVQNCSVYSHRTREKTEELTLKKLDFFLVTRTLYQVEGDTVAANFLGSYTFLRAMMQLKEC